MNRFLHQSTNLIFYSISIACTLLALLLPDWKHLLMAEGYYTSTPAITSVTTSDNSFGLWGDDIAPEPDCYGSIGNCPGKSFIDNSAWSIPNGKSEWNSNVSSTNFTAQTFSARYTNELRTEGQVAINTALYYKPRFNVTVSIAGEGHWSLEVDVSRVASIVIRERDGGSDNRIDVTGLTTTINGANLVSGNLNLASLPRYSTQGTFAVNQTNKGFINGNGPATLTFAMVYDINTRVHGATIGNSDSDCWMAGQANQGAGIDCNPAPQSGQGLWLKGTLHINTPPVAVADSYTADTATATTIGNVLANDTDADGNTLSVLGIDTSETLGSLTDNGDGTFAYDASTAFGYLDETQNATDRFFYRASDGGSGSNLTTVTITVHGTRPAVLPLDGVFRGGIITDQQKRE